MTWFDTGGDKPPHQPILSERRRREFECRADVFLRDILTSESSEGREPLGELILRLRARDASREKLWARSASSGGVG